MKDLQWFPPIPEPRAASAPPVIWSVVVGAAFGLLLLARGHRILAMVVWVAALLLALGLNSPALRRPILRAAHWLGASAGCVTTLALLWPFYVLVFGAIRLALSLTRVDLLGLRLHSEWPSYWQPAAPERKRAEYYERLFTVEPARQESHFFAWAIGIFVLVMVLAGSSELILRSMGFGNPVVYRVNPHVGYYPAPNQDVHRYGGEIHINAFGMRSRVVAAEKPAGTFRILMLGDSILYGGSYIDQREIYASRLEDLLNQKPGLLPGSPQKVEVLCMGVNGWGPQHELAFVKEFGLFHADLVMVMGPPADAYRPRYGIGQFPFFVEGHRPQFAWQEFGDHLLWEYELRLTGAGESFESGPQAGQVLADGVAAWLGIATLAQAQRARVDFELLPNEEEAREGKAGESTQRVLDALLPELAKRRVPNAYPLLLFRNNLGVPKLYHDGAHLDTSGHKIYAGYLYDRVLQLASAK
ncbi:MAG: hypothetical protein ABSA59_21005 [Terriglobia bacterium]|jgi:hypothetical protein